MGTSKTEIFNRRQNLLALRLRALAHPARIAIIEELLARDACVCGELVSQVGLAQSTVSQHLKALKAAGIIKGKVSGSSVCYCIDSDVWEELTASFTHFFKYHKPGTQCC
jgi:DNA-binding transcriptional ArsR family regulator